MTQPRQSGPLREKTWNMTLQPRETTKAELFKRKVIFQSVNASGVVALSFRESMNLFAIQVCPVKCDLFCFTQRSLLAQYFGFRPSHK